MPTHRVDLSSHRVELSSRVVESSSRVVESSSRVVEQVVESSRRVMIRRRLFYRFQIEAAHFFLCFATHVFATHMQYNTQEHEHGKNMAERRLQQIREYLRVGLQTVITRFDEGLFERPDGHDYLCTHVDRMLNVLAHAATLYNIPVEIEETLQTARQMLLQHDPENNPAVFRSSGNRGRPSVIIHSEQLELYLGYGFSQTKIAQMFGVSTKTIQRRILEFGIVVTSHDELADMELDTVV